MSKQSRAGLTKSLLTIFLPISILISFTLYSVYKIETNSSNRARLINEEHLTDLYMESASNLFNNAMRDTILLSRSEEISTLFTSTKDSSSEKLRNELLSVCELTPSCAGVSVLNGSGNEMAGITRSSAGVTRTNEIEPGFSNKFTHLHDKSLSLAKGEAYLSPVELRVERNSGSAEKRPFINIISPVFNDNSERAGSVVLSLRTEKLISHLKRPLRDSINQHFIVDRNGYILYGGPQIDKDDSIREDITGHNFAELYPRLWTRISTVEYGQLDAAANVNKNKFWDGSIRNSGIYTHLTIHNTGNEFTHAELKKPEEIRPINGSEAYWKVISYLPEEITSGSKIHVKYLLAELALLLITLVISILYKVNITKKLKAEAKSRAHETRYRMLHQSSFDGIVLANSEGLIVESNPSMEEIFGYSSEELSKMMLTDLLPTDTREDKNNEFNEAIDIIADDGINPAIQLEGRHSSGNRFPMELTINHIEIEDSVFIACTIRDISERQISEETIRKLAYYDQLTGLPNRTLFSDRLHQAIIRARRNKLQLGLLLLDFDRFKSLNDTFGYTAGDEFLRAVANRLKDNVRAADSVAHLGGDEFVLFLSDKNAIDEIMTFANKLSALFKQSFELNGYEFIMCCSVGISIYPHDGSDVTTLMKCAVAAMSKAKGDGGDGVSLYSPSMNSRVAERLKLENNLRRAQERGEFFLNYQPQVDSATGKVVGVEALLRWKDSSGRLIPPAEFIPLAESLRLIVPIGEWVLRNACKCIKALHQEGLDDLNVSVNVSLFQLTDKKFQETLSKILDDTGLNPKHLELEITESVAMENVSQTIEILHNLKSLGVKLSIDDFGTGYSSLSHLKRMPIDILKIDRSFINELTEGEDDRMLVKTIINIGHSFNNRVVAEGVETIEQYRILKDYGCDIIQGYLFSKPIPAEDIRDCYHSIIEGRLNAEEKRQAHEDEISSTTNKNTNREVKEVI